METPILAASRIYDLLVNGRGTAKAAAITAIEDPTAGFDRTALRALISQALTVDYVAPTAGEQEDLTASDTRCWLLSALGRVSDDDKSSARLVRERLDSAKEPYRWARYWALEGLIAANPGDIEELCHGAAQDPDPLVNRLATAVLASRGQADSLRSVQESLESNDEDVRWAMLRALRIVPITQTSVVKLMCEIVSNGKYSDITYDSIFALSQITPGTRQAEYAAQALANYVTQYHWPMYDAMRTRALIGLGNLRIERTAAIIIEELSCDNPSIMHEASRALEKVLGVRMAVTRVLEAATRAGNGTLGKYASALRWMDRQAVLDELDMAMVSGSEDQQEAARSLLSEIGGTQAFQKLQARTNLIRRHIDAQRESDRRIRELFDSSLHEARSGFRLATIMDSSVFFTGIVLIIISAAIVLYQKGNLDQWAGVGAVATAGGGVLGVIYGILIAKPRERVRESVNHLTDLKIVFLAYLHQIDQAEQAYNRRLLENDPIPPDEVGRYSDVIGKIMNFSIDKLRNIKVINTRSE